MEHKLRKIYFTIVIILAILAGAAAIVFAASFDVDKTSPDAGIHTFFGIAYWTCVRFIAIAILGMLGFALYQIIVNLKEQPKKVRGTLIGVAAFIVVFAVAINPMQKFCCHHLNPPIIPLSMFPPFFPHKLTAPDIRFPHYRK